MTNIHDKPALGDRVLVGMTYFDREGRVTGLRQFFGVLVKMNERAFTLDTDGGEETHHLPPVLEGFILAPRGEYRCMTEGQIIRDPDFLSCWTVRPAEKEGRYTAQPVKMPFYRHDLPDQWDFDYRHDPDFIQAQMEQLQASYLNKTVLIGVTHLRSVDGEDKVISQEQKFGTVSAWNLNVGIEVTLKSNEVLNLPPDATLLQPSDFSEFHLRSTGEVIHNPDFVTIWNVYHPEQEDPSD
jgi:hypothetical protein